MRRDDEATGGKIGWRGTVETPEGFGNDHETRTVYVRLICAAHLVGNRTT